MKIIYNVRHCYPIHLKFGDKVIAQRESKYLLYNQRKSTFILLYVFGICCCCHNLTYFYNKVHNHKETLLVIEAINFTIESSAFQNRHLTMLIPSQI